ncbi:MULTISPECIES: hypothetical protein [unclassified Paraburkholderia]|uniref:hypothetical protein n=1 Tax=unclassified Paraburkholderia TaxID=2615204 RepID=UPI0016227C1C|nr:MULTISPECIES: hypothetical protein [unclassified Paraburkholderia]MBB5448358.1 hypothetical protein [Paraburkholderia sp. WSM4177]MBB5488739.1 hypothetical protein [Paraburkholderia sp. WSM4180]
MSTGQLAIRLSSPSWGTGSQTLAMAEVTAAPRSGTRAPILNIPLGVNDAPKNLSLDAGQYLVRLFLPSGEVQAERVDVRDGGLAELNFDIGESPHEWLGSAASLGIVQTLPRVSEARSLEAALSRPAPAIFRSGSNVARADTLDLLNRSSTQFRELAAKAVLSLDRSTSELDRISGHHRVAQSEGWRWIHRVSQTRAFPKGRLSPVDLARWWTGDPVSDPVRMNLVQSDERNARLMPPVPASGALMNGDGARAFAAVCDPVGGTYYAVFPEGWASTSQYRLGQLVAPSVLLTVVIDTAMTSADSRSSPARWRCAPEIDDVESMSLLGFLHAGLAEAGQMMLERAHAWLFEKSVNPVSAAAGAYMLLSHTEEANVRLDPDWRRWVGNLYRRFPTIPDAAIAMAQMAMTYGETGRGDEIDVEKLRGYALEAVRRGLPYLGTGVRRLTDVLVAIEGDDRAEMRSGPQVEGTRMALALVRELGRVTVPGEFFTVLRLDEERT